ncbi:MAG: hypothetical protein NTY38_09945 [Acidobacteria bacterium]|nr:hypothetical protein [Acidobacteriota bacterium]
MMESTQQNREGRQDCGAQGAVWTALDAWEAPPVSADFNRRLYARIETEAQAGWWQRLFAPRNGFRWRQTCSLATACMVLVAVLLFNSPVAPPARPQPKTESVDIEQVERSLEDMEMLQQLNPVAKVEKPAVGESL